MGSKVSKFCYIKVTVFSILLIRFTFFRALLGDKIGRIKGSKVSKFCYIKVTIYFINSIFFFSGSFMRHNWKKKWDLKVSKFCYIKVTIFSILLIRFSFFQALLRDEIGRKSGI